MAAETVVLESPGFQREALKAKQAKMSLAENAEAQGFFGQD